MSVDKRIFQTEIEYPQSDGEPMAETDIHRDLMVDLIEGLKYFYRDEPLTYVSGNMMMYYEEGNPAKSISPDVFFVRGIPKHRRRIYKIWQEGRPPDVVFEISSRGTWGKDLQKNWRLYARLGVQEYFIFDPEYDYLEPSLNAYRLADGEYEAMEIIDRRVKSAVLGLELVDTGETLRLFDPTADQFIPTYREIAAARERAEADIVRLREEIANLKKQA